MRGWDAYGGSIEPSIGVYRDCRMWDSSRTPALRARGAPACAGAWNQSELVKRATFFWNDRTPIDFSLLQGPSANGLEAIRNPGGALGTPLAAAPSFQGNFCAL